MENRPSITVLAGTNPIYFAEGAHHMRAAGVVPQSYQYSDLETVLLSGCQFCSKLQDVVMVQSSTCARHGLGRPLTPMRVGRLIFEGQDLPLMPAKQSAQLVQEAVSSKPVRSRGPGLVELVQEENRYKSAPVIPARPRNVDVTRTIRETVEELLGTAVLDDAPLMGAGLDSISAVELVSQLELVCFESCTR